MQDCIAAVEELLDELGKTLSPERKGRLITLVYDLEQEQRGAGHGGANTAAIIRLVRAA